MNAHVVTYWEKIRTATPIQRALAVSVALHTLAGVAVVTMPDQVDRPPVPITQEIQFVELTKAEPIEEEVKPKPVVEKPKVEKPKPEKKAVKVAKKAPEKPKPKKVEKPKPAVKEPAPEPEVKKVERVEVARKPEEPTPIKPKPEVVPEPPTETGIKIKEELPAALNLWGRLVQRKVERNWVIPGGIRLDKEHAEAVISFWVDREGRLIGKPKIVTKGVDPALVQSGMNAIIWAEPLPPLPDGYEGVKQEVVYAFNLVKPSLTP